MTVGVPGIWVIWARIELSERGKELARVKQTLDLERRTNEALARQAAGNYQRGFEGGYARGYEAGVRKGLAVADEARLAEVLEGAKN